MNDTKTSGFAELVQDIKNCMKVTCTTEVNEWLQAGKQFVLIDVREDAEWEKGHIPGATHLSKGIIERDIENTVADKDQEIVLYCGGGSRSVLAADNLKKMGYKNVVSMDGGWRGWLKAGYSTQS